MKKIKIAFRLAGLAFMIVLALCGVGLAGMFPTRREQDYDNEIKTELAEGEEDQIETGGLRN